MLKFSNKKTGLLALVVIFVAVFAVFADSVQAAPIVSVTATPLKELHRCPLHPDILAVESVYIPDFENTWRYDVAIDFNDIDASAITKLELTYKIDYPSQSQCAQLAQDCYLSSGIQANTVYEISNFSGTDLNLSYTTFNRFEALTGGWHDVHALIVVLYYNDGSTEPATVSELAQGYDIVPEPLTAAMLAGGLGLLIKRRRSF